MSSNARECLDNLADKRGWRVDYDTFTDPKDCVHPVSVYTTSLWHLRVVWTCSDHVSYAVLTQLDSRMWWETPHEWWSLPGIKRWDKRFGWCATHLYDLAPTIVRTA